MIRNTTMQRRWLAAAAMVPVSLGLVGASAAAGDSDDDDGCTSVWDNTVGQPGFNSNAFAFVEYDGDLHAAGQFATAGGVTVNRVARWGGGATWHALGSGVNGAVLGATVYDDSLVVVGGFNVAGGQTAHRVARWDGSAWHTLGDGIVAWAARAAVVYEGDLIVGGELISADGHDVNNITRWDGSAWHPMGTGVDGLVFALAVFEGDLIVGGQFTVAGGQPANRVARWDGSAWHPMGSGMDGQVSTLYIHNGDLYAGGQFEVAGGQPAGRIARWNPDLPGGGNWEEFGGGVNSWVNRIHAFEGDLVIGGLFTLAGGVSADRIARWDDSAQTWHPLGAGVNWTFLPTVSALGVYDGDLFVSGQFSTAGGLPSSFVAVWTGCPDEPGIVGDLDGNGVVNVFDLLILLGEWGRCAECTPEACPADLDGDCAVNVFDLLILLGNWG